MSETVQETLGAGLAVIDPGNASEQRSCVTAVDAQRHLTQNAREAIQGGTQIHEGSLAEVRPTVAT